MRISDWSSDVCSSDLNVAERLRRSWGRKRQGRPRLNAAGPGCCFIRQGLTGESSSLSATRMIAPTPTSRPTSPMIQLELPSSSFAPVVAEAAREALDAAEDRKSVVEGKSVPVRVDLGGRLTIKKKNNNHTKYHTK